MPYVIDPSDLISRARSLPELLTMARQFNPTLANALSGKALIASKSTWGPAATAIVSWSATHYGLGWDVDTCGIASGALVFGVSAILRYFTSGPITGIFVRTPTIAPAPLTKEAVT